MATHDGRHSRKHTKYLFKQTPIFQPPFRQHYDDDVFSTSVLSAHLACSKNDPHKKKKNTRGHISTFEYNMSPHLDARCRRGSWMDTLTYVRLKQMGGARAWMGNDSSGSTVDLLGINPLLLIAPPPLPPFQFWWCSEYPSRLTQSPFERGFVLGLPSWRCRSRVCKQTKRT